MEKPSKPADFVRVVHGCLQVWHRYDEDWMDLKWVDGYDGRCAASTLKEDHDMLQGTILAACELAVEAYIEKLQPPYPYQPVEDPATLRAIDKTAELFCDEDEEAGA